MKAIEMEDGILWTGETENLVFYLHSGGFGAKEDSGQAPGTALLLKSMDVFVMKYESPPDSFKDLNRACIIMDRFFAAGRIIHLLGISRGGFLGFHRLFSVPGIIHKAAICCAPFDTELWLKSAPIQPQFKSYFINSPSANPGMVNCKVPTLLLYGGGDTIVPAKQGKLASAQMPTSMLQVVPGQGHNLMSKPGAMQKVVKWFESDI